MATNQPESQLPIQLFRAGRWGGAEIENAEWVGTNSEFNRSRAFFVASLLGPMLRAH